MSPANVHGRRQEVEAVIDALNSRDFDELAALVHAQVELHSLLAGVDGGTFRGVDGLRRWRDEVDATWDGVHLEVLDFREVTADQAVAVVRNSGTARASDVPLDLRSWVVVTWREGKIWRTVVRDRDDYVEALGQRE